MLLGHLDFFDLFMAVPYFHDQVLVFSCVCFHFDLQNVRLFHGSESPFGCLLDLPSISMLRFLLPFSKHIYVVMILSNPFPCVLCPTALYSVLIQTSLPIKQLQIRDVDFFFFQTEGTFYLPSEQVNVERRCKERDLGATREMGCLLKGETPKTFTLYS